MLLIQQVVTAARKPAHGLARVDKECLMERRKDNTIQMGGGASAVYLYRNRISGIKAGGGTQAVTMWHAKGGQVVVIQARQQRS